VRTPRGRVATSEALEHMQAFGGKRERRLF